jgi:hypothetical protein
VIASADAIAAKQRNTAMKRDERWRMLVYAPGVDRWYEVDSGIRRILKLHANGGYLAELGALDGGNSKVGQSGEVACGVHQRRVTWHAHKKNLQRAAIALLLMFLTVTVPLKV